MPLKRMSPSGVADHALAERAMHAVGDQRFSGAGGIDQPRREIHGIAKHGVVVDARAAVRARDHLAAGDADMRVSGRDDLFGSASAAWMSSAARAARSASVSCARGAPKSAITASPMCLSMVPP